MQKIQTQQQINISLKKDIKITNYSNTTKNKDSNFTKQQQKFSLASTQSSNTTTITNYSKRYSMRNSVMYQSTGLQPKGELYQQMLFQKQQEIQQQQERQRQKEKEMAEFFLEGIQQLNLTSQSYTIFDVKLQRIIYQYQGSFIREMASLTKIMTCHIICKYIQQGLIDQNQQVVVSKIAASQVGTSAELKQGDKLTVIDLLHGLMLPSGNDAAQALAEFMGKILFKKTEMYKRRKYDNQKGNLCTNKDGYRCFINEMNKTARDYNLKNTQYANPHGLSHKFNRSCSNDLAKLSNISMNKSQLFRNIVQQQYYSCDITEKNGTIRQFTWQNTNKLILDNKYGCIGIKTGITPWAGPCMSTSFKYENRHLIIIILRADHVENRFSESSKILEWTIDKYLQYDKKIQNKENNEIKSDSISNESLFDESPKKYISNKKFPSRSLLDNTNNQAIQNNKYNNNDKVQNQDSLQNLINQHQQKFQNNNISKIQQNHQQQKIEIKSNISKNLDSQDSLHILENQIILNNSKQKLESQNNLKLQQESTIIQDKYNKITQEYYLSQTLQTQQQQKQSQFF